MDFLEFLFRAVFSVVFIGFVVLGVFVFAYFMARLLGVFTDWMDEILDGDRDKFGR